MMGSLFAKPKPPSPVVVVSRVTEQDKAVLQLKQQRDKLKQYQKRIELNIKKDRELAKKLLADGKRDRAKSVLQKKKYQENVLQNTDSQLDHLEQLTEDIEFAMIEEQVMEGLRKGNDALRRIHELLTIDEIEKILDETREGIDKQREIDEVIADQLSYDDDRDVEYELDAILCDEIHNVLPDVPDEKLPETDPEEAKPEEAKPEEAKPEKVSSNKPRISFKKNKPLQA